MERNNVIQSVTGAIVLSVLVAIILWLGEYFVMAAIILSAIVALAILLIVLVTSHVTRAQTIATMQAGADIALQAQNNNDRWDVQKGKVIGDVLREGVKTGREQARLMGQNSLPQLLPPSQSDEWDRPDIMDFSESDIIDLDELE